MSLASVVWYVYGMLVSSANQSCSGIAEGVEEVSHDTLNRVLSGKVQLLMLMQKMVKVFVGEGGYLILDDTTLQKFTKGLACTCKLKDTKTGGFILGIQVVLLAWSDGKRCVPIALQLYRGKDQTNKHDLALQLLRQAQHLGFKPEYVLFGSWYGSQELLTAIRDMGWHFVSRLRKNRSLNKRQLQFFRPTANWSALGKLKGDIAVVVYRRNSEYFVSSNLDLECSQAKALYRIRSLIEEVFKVLKQHCGWHGVQQKTIRSYRRHLTLGLITLLFLEYTKNCSNTSIYHLRRLYTSGRLAPNKAVLERFILAA